MIKKNKLLYSLIIILSISTLLLSGCYYAKSKVSYVRTDGYVAYAQYPQSYAMYSLSDLENYYYTNKDTYNLQSSYKKHNSFSGVIKKYDMDYFEDNMLIVVVIEGGSNAYKVKAVENIEHNIYVTIKRTVSLVTCDDSAIWHILIEYEKIEEINDMSVRFSL